MKLFIPLLMLFLPALLFSQNELYNQSNSIYVQSGAIVHVQGTVTNAATGSGQGIYNDGVIEVEGNLINNSGAVFKPNTGTGVQAVKFVGNTANATQTIQGSLSTPGTSTLYNLIIDTKNSGQLVQMQTNVNIDGSLVFGSATTGANTYTPTTTSTLTNNSDKGIIQTYNGTTDYELYITNPSVDAVMGYPTLGIHLAPTDGYIQTRGAEAVGLGGFSRAVNTTGAYNTNTKYVFPIGSSTHGFNGVALAFTVLNSTKVRGLFVDDHNGSNTAIGSLTQICYGCSEQYPTPDNNGVNIIYGNSSTPNAAFPNNPCNAGQQWVILQDGILNHGYWSFAGNASLNNDEYVIETFPNDYGVAGPYPTYYVDNINTWRTMMYYDAANPATSTSINFDPGPVAVNWNNGLWNVSDVYDILRYTRNANTGCYSGTGVPGGVYKGLGHFTMKKSFSPDGNALPVQMVSLIAEPVNNQFIQVSWTTDLEINNKGFVIERSTDAINFDSIGWVTGHDNSTATNNYALNDMNVVPGVVYYYRLMQEDNNDTKTPTGIVQASLTGNTVFTVGDPIPNPATDNSHLMITTGIEQFINMKVYDGIGRLMSTKGYSLSAGENEIALNTGILAAGTYMIIISTDNQYYSRKLVVVR